MKSIFTQIVSIFFFLIICNTVSFAQTDHDSLSTIVNSVAPLDTTIHPKSYTATLDSLLKRNKYLNVTAAPVSLALKEKQPAGKETLFYVLAITVLLLALCKVFYRKYFNNIFRVFFNTSLRQNQLTDLLLQAKLPSLIFNIFFIISLGLYLWLLINHYSQEQNNYVFAGLSILFIAIVYLGKFISLKVIGWVCGMNEAADQYIFVIFLINKIIGILLIPFIILLAFAPAYWLNILSISSFCILGLLLIMRYLRSYGLLQSKLKLNPFHFLIYLAAVEFLPFLIVYKVFAHYLLTK